MTMTSKEGSQFDPISTKVIDLSSASEQPVKVVIETITPTAATALDPQNKIRKGRFIVENVGSDSGSIASDAATPAIHNNSMGVESISNGQQREDANNSTATAPRTAAETSSSKTALVAPVPLRSNASFTSVSTSSVSSHNVLLASSETSVAPEITKKGRFMVINTSANSTQQEVSTVPATIISISPALVAASTPIVSSATSAAGSHRDQLVMNDVADRGNGICTASSSSFIPPKKLISHIPAAGATTITAVSTVVPVVSKLDIAGIGMSSSSHVPNTSASSSSSTVRTSSVAPLTPTNPSTASSIATIAADPANKKAINSIGKVYHFLDEIRQEVQEVDKLNRSLQNDMKFFRDKNKELEGRNRELEKKLLEEKNLRETAEIKLAQMKKKMTEMKRNLAILSTATDPTLPESTATNNSKPAKREQQDMLLGGVDTTHPVEQQDSTNSPRNSPRRMFSSCENFKSIAVADEEDSSTNKTHRKTSSLFCPTSNGSDSRIRASSVGGDDTNSPPPPSAAMKRGIPTKTEKVFLRPPLPTSATAKQRKESLESISSTFSDLSLMDNTMITSTKAGDCLEYDRSRNTVESLANSNSKATSKPPSSTDPMVANKAPSNHMNDAILPSTTGISSTNSTTPNNLLILEESSASDGIRIVNDDSWSALTDPIIPAAPEEKDPFEEIFSGRRTTPF
mmetsp:Transcript_9719/g.14051  ORF Transcript_9719/g.14051 Transcript_9719/m.14051 type:complete len:687 (+) Transcript_9719:124-2184(+)